MPTGSYRTICMSVFYDDLALLDTLVAEMKQAGHRSFSRSEFLRRAVRAAWREREKNRIADGAGRTEG